MNLADFYVTEIKSVPFCEYDRWWLKVKAITYGVESEHVLMFNTEEQANNVEIGYHFMG
ncbi:MAG: hypothetical protein ACOCVF_00770 [bacterium]